MNSYIRRTILLLILAALIAPVVILMTMKSRGRISREQEISHQRMMIAHFRAFALKWPAEFRRLVMLNVDKVSDSGTWTTVTNKTSALLGQPLYEDLGNVMLSPYDVCGDPYRIKLKYTGSDSCSTGISEKYEITLWSVGDNGRDDQGKRDDIVVGPFQVTIFDVAL